MPQQIYDFPINKFSIFQRDNTWHHFPQRSDLSISFIDDQSDEVTVTVHWRGSSLDNFSLLLTDKCVTTALCKSPSIGIKQCDKYGNILKRFQISFIEEVEYIRCCNNVSQIFKFNLNNKDHISTSSQMSSSQVLQTPNSQIIHQNSHAFVQCIPQSQRIYSQHQQVYYPSPSSQQEARGAAFPSTQEFVYPSMAPSNPVSVYSHLPEQVPNISMDNLDELKKLTDSSLRAAIRNQIKSNPDFVDFVSRLDRILGDI